MSPARSLLFVGMICTAPLCAQAVFPFSPSADATTNSALASSNFGSDVELNFGKVSTSTGPSAGYLRGHVMFDVSSLVGTGLVPVRATFYWYQSRSNAAGCLDVSVHRLLAPWSETTVTWQNQPAHDPVAESMTCVGNSFDLGWKAFDVTAVAQDWLDGSAVNHGFVIRDPNERSAGASRPGYGHSREFGTASLTPYLEIELADSIGVGCSTHATTPSLAVTSGSSQLEGSLVITASNLVPGSTMGGFFGFNPLATPLSLATIGFPNCNIWIAPELQASLPSPTGTTLDFVIAVPDVTALVGSSIHAQFAAITPTFGLEVTNGIAARIYE